MENEKVEENRGFHIYGGSCGDTSVGIPSLSFELDIDAGDQGLTKDWKETLDSECCDEKFRYY
jgi:hypothetical protein